MLSALLCKWLANYIIIVLTQHDNICFCFDEWDSRRIISFTLTWNILLICVTHGPKIQHGLIYHDDRPRGFVVKVIGQRSRTLCHWSVTSSILTTLVYEKNEKPSGPFMATRSQPAPGLVTTGRQIKDSNAFSFSMQGSIYWKHSLV